VIGLLQKENFARSITGLEISSSGLERILARALPNVTAVQFDGYKSEFPDKAFDLALSIHVLEHVEHERLYLKELARISRQAVIEVPLELTANCRKVMAITGRCGHINFYQRETFENILRTSGLNIRTVVVNTVRRDLDIHMSGKARGVLKNVIRSTALRLSERLARFQFVYLCTAYVDCP
jgi:ubiquinone/menaquinone biosynthesis C-methylase UbiE